MEQDKFDVFISYSRKELDRVKQVKSVVEDTVKTKCWMDLNAIESGSSRFTKDIVEGINQCHVFLFMFSENSQNSKFALRELDFAEKKGKHIVIVNIDGCTMNDEFMFLYGLSDTISWDDEPQREKLLRDLKKWVGHEEVSDDILSNGDVAEWNRRGDDAYHAKNYSEAVKWYRKAAEQGNAWAQYNLGFLFSWGYGVKQDYAEAIKWYRKAAEQGDIASQCNLGSMYYFGDGVERDYTEAFNWYKKPAEQGDKFGQFYLGRMYENGYGVMCDYAEALKWYKKAAEQGYEDAKKKVAELSCRR